MADYFVHESSYVDENVQIGSGTKIWHFCHIQSGARIGEHCSLGQNVNVSNRVRIGNHCKIQNNVSLYEGVELEDGVFCGPSCVFTNDLTPRAEYPKGREGYQRTLIQRGASIGCGSGCDEGCARLCAGGWSSGAGDWTGGRVGEGIVGG